ncbi:fungal-specific transcription factor domain-containing protein [Elsinoe ampelina]|uniref:Fungal-specific transcription factor domain-containing protein n=1 Tax=Elsinoe ampelina TaxID=302913 RepID=A0A6A6G1W2_9PEZI|nr:fungal-specific transcription factor domain-containing protein [Elsinoe ampelina]
MLMYPTQTPFAVSTTTAVGSDAFFPDPAMDQDNAKAWESLFPPSTFSNSQRSGLVSSCVHSPDQYWPACCCPSCRQQGLVMSNLNLTSTPIASPVDGQNGHITPALQSPARDSSASTPEAGGKPKQKRNKPTLSCQECVERKTKCDRGRPNCLSCIKRQTDCHYTQIANLIASAKTTGGAKARYVTKPSIKARKTNSVSSTATTTSRAGSEGPSQPSATLKRKIRPSSTPYLGTALPYSRSTPSNVFGVGAQHPFSNYWTCSGGVAEVVGVLPSKEQADILVAKYFEVMDPVYPFIHRRTFFTNYERFWAQPLSIKNDTDADLLALHYTIYALGTQFMQFPSYEERASSAEFYASAANQALRIYSYLNRASMRSMAAMTLLTYFLMNDNHASDAYAWSGILLRQAYALRLHRDPEFIDLNISEIEKQTRRRLWQAVFFQDTFLTVLLKLPPTATHSDVQLDNLMDEASLKADGFEVDIPFQSRVENLMSINVIAPPVEVSLPPPPVDITPYLVDHTVDKADVEYIRSMWKLGNLVQENLSSPMSLNLPLVSSPRQKTSLVSSFRALYRSFPNVLTILDFSTLQAEATVNPRGVRQNLFLTSNFYHCLMILQASENDEAGVECNIRGSLEAAHEALWSFFKLVKLFELEATVWWVFQHRAFEEAVTIAKLLSIEPTQDVNVNDALYTKCKNDVMTMIDFLKNGSRGNLEMQRTRLLALEEAFDKIVV